MEHVLISYHYYQQFLLFHHYHYYRVLHLLLLYFIISNTIIKNINNITYNKKIKIHIHHTLKTSTHSPRLISNDVHTFSTILERIHRTYFGEVFICILGNCCPYQPTVIYHLEGIFGNASGRLGSWLQDHCLKWSCLIRHTIHRSHCFHLIPASD